MSAHSEDAFVADLRRALDADLERLPGHTLDGLALARRRALDAAGRRPFPARLFDLAGGHAAGRLAAATGALAALGLAIGLWLHEPALPLPDSGLEDIAMLSGSEELDMLSELDFYEWLADARPTG